MDQRSTHTARTSGYSARELAERAGTTVRTIHYYTAEGLLPSPAGSTRAASYTAAHLARLRLIAALRDEGLALGKIRERLAPLTDEQSLHVVEALDEHLAAPDAGPLTTLGLIDLELTRQNLPSFDEEVSDPFIVEQGPVAYLIAPPAAPASQPERRADSAREYLDRVLRRNEGVAPARQQRLPPRDSPTWNYNQPSAEPPEVWYQYQLDDGIELRLREDRYRQTKGRPGALIDAVRASLYRHGLLHDREDDAPQR